MMDYYYMTDRGPIPCESEQDAIDFLYAEYGDQIATEDDFNRLYYLNVYTENDLIK